MSVEDEDVAGLEADLRLLGSAVMTGPSPYLVADAVLHRLRDKPAPAQASFSLLANGDQLVRRWRAVVAVVLAAVLILLVATPVGATVARWFGFGGVEVVQVPVAPATSPPVVSPAGADLSLDQAASLAGFAPFVPRCSAYRTRSICLPIDGSCR